MADSEDGVNSGGGEGVNKKSCVFKKVGRRAETRKRRQPQSSDGELLHVHGHPSAAEEAWHWPKRALRIG